MTKIKVRKQYSRDLKLKIVLELLRGEKTLSQLSSDYGVHSTQLKEWKDQALEAMSERFSIRRGRKDKGVNERTLYEEIGRLKVEVDFLQGKLEA